MTLLQQLQKDVAFSPPANDIASTLLKLHRLNQQANLQYPPNGIVLISYPYACNNKSSFVTPKIARYAAQKLLSSAI